MLLPTSLLCLLLTQGAITSTHDGDTTGPDAQVAPPADPKPPESPDDPNDPDNPNDPENPEEPEDPDDCPPCGRG